MFGSKIPEKLKFRLPRELKPVKYKLKLNPDLRKKTFYGNVTINLEVLKPISFIPVHSKLLHVSTERVDQLNEHGALVAEVPIKRTFEYPQYEYWVTEFASPLDVGSYSIYLNFNGSLTGRIIGFYESFYMDKNRNQTRWIATSKFEPTFARQAFPCFDEPDMKAQFTITLVRPSGDGYHALSNMNVEHEENLGDVTEVYFSESVPMSTYLVCIIVSDFKHKSKIVNGVLSEASDFEIRVFATPAQIDKVDFALSVGVDITQYYIGYFNISYPLPKLDMAAIPDFVSGATEHWGLVTYRESSLLFDPTTSSSVNKQNVARTISHELAHMWFGNLVTMKWWNDLWLNEGFATYIQYKGINHVHPDWDILAQFLVMDLNHVMILDATLASHPIVQTVESPNQITELFDSISYSKGASIIRMLEDIVGEVKFRNATSNYLRKFYYQNAETDDFFAEIESQDFDFDVKLIMQTWTQQMGFPVVEVTRAGDSLKLTQKRFFSNLDDYNGVYEDSQFNYHWSIPITYFTSADSTIQRSIFNYNDKEVTVAVPTDAGWIKFNKNQVGFYRVNYPVDMWKALISVLRESRDTFSTSDRAHLISDAFALADASQLGFNVALDLSTYLEKELDFVPWEVASLRLLSVSNLVYYTNLYSDFITYARKLLTPIVNSITFNVDTDHLQNLLRNTVLKTACELEHKAAVQEAANRFNAWLNDPSVRPQPDIRNIVYVYGMKEVGNEKIWNQVWDLFVIEGDSQEKLKLMQSLSAIQVPWILQRFINLAWNEKYVRGQDYFTCLSYISHNRIGENLVWDYVRENWIHIAQRFGINERRLGQMIPLITQRFSTQIKLDEMEVFFDKHPEAGAGTASRKVALEKVKNNIKWLAMNQEEIGAWLEHQKTQ